MRVWPQLWDRRLMDNSGGGGAQGRAQGGGAVRTTRSAVGVMLGHTEVSLSPRIALLPPPAASSARVASGCPFQWGKASAT